MDIKAALTQYNNAIEALEAAELLVQTALAAIKVASGSATVNVSGQFFQVRDRKDKLYLCELTGKPRGRPKGSKNSKPRVGSKRALAADGTAAADGTTAEGTAEEVTAEVTDTTEAITAEAIPENTGTFVISSHLLNSLDSAPAESVG